MREFFWGVTMRKSETSQRTAASSKQAPFKLIVFMEPEELEDSSKRRTKYGSFLTNVPANLVVGPNIIFIAEGETSTHAIETAIGMAKQLSINEVDGLFSEVYLDN